MQILLIILIAVIGILILTGLFFFYSEIITVFYDFKKWITQNKKKSIAIVVASSVVLAIPFLFLPVGDPAGIDLSDWTYHKLITIDHTKIDATLTNFPILFDNTSSDFAHAQSDGDDFLFVSSDNNTQYNHEIESYNASGNNRLIAWVNITTLSADTDTVLWLYYGNTTCSSQQDVAGTWNSGFVAVYHMNDSSGGITDATSNNNDGSEVGGGQDYEQTGIVGYAIDINNVANSGTNEFNCGDVDATPDVTITFWQKSQTSINVWRNLVSKANDYAFQYHSDSKLWADVKTGTDWFGAGTTRSLDVWYFEGCIFDNTGEDLYVYTNGTQTSSELDRGTRTTNNNDLLIGDWGSPSESFDGLIDEIRISNVNRGADWIKTEYNNMNSPSTFLSVGSEQTQAVNNAPTLAGEIPANASTDVSRWTSCNVTCNDLDGDSLTVYFYENTTGSWVLQQTNSSHTANTSAVWGNYTNASTYSMTYWWSVNCTDSEDWVNATYHFTTEANPWWDTDWGYYKTITVADKIDDYQMKINITKSSGGNVTCEGHCNDNFSDIRFVYDNTTELPYWIEETVSGSYSIMWVNNSGNYSSFEMFYGNSAVGNNSDGNTTFDFFDDFPGSSLDGSKWTTANGNDGTVTVANSEVRLYAPEDAGKINVAFIYTSQLSNAPFALRIIGWNVDQVGNEHIQLNTGSLTSDYANQVRYDIYDQSVGGGGNSDLIGDIYDGAVREEEFRDANVGDTYDATDMDILIDSSRNVQFLIQGVDKGTANAPDDVTFRIRLFAQDGRGTSEHYIDTIFLRKYADTEPSWSAFGSEQSQVGWSNSNPVASSPNPSDTQTGVTLSLANYYNHFNISVIDVDNSNQSINVTWRTNESGAWLDMGYNESSEMNATFYCTNASWVDSYNTKYWWSVNVSDNHSTKGWDNNTYSFTSIDLPSSPTSLTANNPTTSSIDLNWTRGYFSNSTEYFVDDAEYQFAFHDTNSPSSWYVNNVTYIVYAGDTGDPYIINYNYTTALWSDSVKVGTNPLSDDNHGNPVLVINQSGYIHVIWGGHGNVNGFEYAISNNPYDITAWTQQSDISNEGTYPHPILLNNASIIIFYREYTGGSGDEAVAYRASWENFGTEHEIVDFTSNNALYIFDSILNSDGTKIYFNWLWYDYDTTTRRNVYCAYFDITDFKLYNVSGTDLGVQINESEANSYCKAYDSSGAFCNDFWMQLDSNDYPYITFNYDNNTIKFIRWTGTSWTSPELITHTDDAWNNAPFVLHNSTGIETYLVTNGTSAGRGGNISKWSWDGATWTEDVVVLEESIYNKPLVFPNIPFNNSNEIEVVFSEYDTTYSTHLKCFAYGDGGFVRNNWETIYTHVRYSTSDNLTSRTDGNQAYNGTGISYNLTGLSSNTQYWFRAWSYGSSTGWNSTGSNTVNETTLGNTAPTLTGEIPSNQSTDIGLIPVCNVTANDADGGDSLTVTFYENTSGSYVLQQKNTSVSPETSVQWDDYSNADSYSTKYWWKVCVDDATDNVSEIYYFTTETDPDVTPPSITINFAGNPGDEGGPYYRPPGESTALAGVWSDGYYTNDSRQSEGWIYINLSVEDGGGVPNVWLQWKNETVWTNYTYAFTNTTGGYFEFNTSGSISTASGYNYSFNIVANDTLGNSKTVWWNKTGAYGSYTRRYVQLNCSTTNISYTPYYFYRALYDNVNKYDRLHHDQGDAGSTTDTAYLLDDTPTDTVESVYCTSGMGYWFDESTCIEPFTLNNIYFHTWYSTDDEASVSMGWEKTRIYQSAGWEDSYTTSSSNGRSEIYYNGPTANDYYHLETHLLDLGTSNYFTDNNIYEACMQILDSTEHPSSICNRSFMTFILFNVPDNATLNASHADTDSDGLSDWNELYTTYTSPFLTDTDNDGVSDYNENLSGSDPNNYTDTTEPALSTSVDSISPYNQTSSPLTITATSSGAAPDNVSLYYRYSEDNSTWDNESAAGDINGFGSEYARDLSDSIEGRIWGSSFTPTSNGTADNMTVHLYTTDSHKVMLALYDNATLSLIANGETEEREVDAGSAYTWFTFNFTGTKPEINTSTEYILCAWANATAGTCNVCFSNDEGVLYAVLDISVAYDGSYPSTISRDGEYEYSTMIYCNYTEVGGGDENWTKFGTDTASPWSWSFNFPEGDGYYEFYSMGNKSGLSNESAPANNDTLCQKLANTAPTLSGEVPINSSTQISVLPSLYVICTDSNSDTMAATWRSNSSGAWVDFATNSSISTGTNITQDNSNFSAESTTYYWSINLTDGMDWINESYHFTTTGPWVNTAPTFSSPSPTNGSSDQSRQVTVNVTVTDADGNSSTCDFYTSTDGSSWTWRQTNTTVLNQSIQYSYVQASSYSTLYYWKVTANDTHDNSSVIYHFTTESEPGADTDYYVSNSTGADSNSGTSSGSPWQNMSKVNSELDGGVISQSDDIYFKRGDSWGGTTLIVRVGGTSSNPMIIGAYDTGANPVIHSTANNGISLDSVGTSWVHIQNFTIHDVAAEGGITAWNVVTHNLSISHCEIYNIDAGNGIAIRQVLGYRIDNCTVHDTNVGGITIYGSVSNRLRDGIVRDTQVYNAGTDAYTLHVQGGQASPLGENHILINCTANGTVGEEYFDITSGINVILKDCTAYGKFPVTINHNVQNLFIIGCHFYDVASNKWGIMTNWVTNMTVRNSKFYNYGSDAIGLDDGSSVGGDATHIYLAHNTIVAESGAASADYSIDHFSNCNYVTVKNNIFTSLGSTPSRLLMHRGATLAGTNSTYDTNMWNRPGASSHWYVGDTGYNLAGWLAFGEVTGAIDDDPELADPANGDFSLNSTSPAIDAGTSLTTTTGGGTGTAITVDESHWFHDGFGLIDGDEITVGTDDVTITDINYDTNVLTVTPSITWSDGDDVSYRYNGSAPDIGAKESSFTAYSTTVRTNAVDYFVWLGTNTTAYYVGLNITGFNEGTEYIAILNNSGSWWKYYYGDGAGGTNWSIYTYDVVKIVMDDAVDNTTFNMMVNPDITYNTPRNVTLVDVGNGYNYTGFTNSTSTTLSAINTTIGFTTYYFCALWNETTFSWNFWIAYWPYNVDRNVHQYDVVLTKISTNRWWEM